MGRGRRSSLSAPKALAKRAWLVALLLLLLGCGRFGFEPLPSPRAVLGASGPCEENPASNEPCPPDPCTNGNCINEPSCSNGLQDGLESDVDCGGPNCSTCVTGGSCTVTTDCESGVCVENLCAAPTCNDNVQNQDETGVDTGGQCAPASAYCDYGVDQWTVALYTFDDLPTSSAADAAGNHPGTFVDGPASPTPGVNGCGGALATNGSTYLDSTHAPEFRLNQGAFETFVQIPNQIPSLEPAPIFAKDNLGWDPDGQLALFITDEGRVVVRSQNNRENRYRCSNAVYDPGTWLHVGVNFGAPDLALYINGERQSYTGNIVVDEALTNASCGGDPITTGLEQNALDLFIGANNWGVRPGIAPDERMGAGGAIDHFRISSIQRDFVSLRDGCSNGIQDRNETAIDCGGVCGGNCEVDAECTSAADCLSGVCSANACQPASCSDQTQNGDETGIDCGGSCGPCDNCDNHPGAFFCTSFEDPAYPEFDSISTVGDAVARGSESRAYRGQNALRVQAPLGADRVDMQANDAGLLTDGDLYIRFYLFLVPGAVYDASATRHLWRYHNNAVTPQYASFGFNLKEGNRIELATVKNGVATFPTTPAGSITAGRWMCMQFHAHIGAADGLVEVDIDGTNYRFDGLDTFPEGAPYRQLNLGMPVNYLNIQRAVVLFDDLVMDTAPIPCD